MAEARIIVSGRVQGVGFRWFVSDQANDIGLKGSVKNLPDGAVEIIAQGKKEEIDRLIETVKIGNRQSYVENLEVDWPPESKHDYDGFKIVF